MVMFDDRPDNARIDAAQKRLDDQIAAAGGLDAWRAAAPKAEPMARKTGNPHRGGTEAYLATEHYNEGWNDCIAAHPEQAEPTANYTMWAVHIQGMDDLYAAPDWEVADATCIVLNAQFARERIDDLTHAVVVPWPHGYEAWKAGAEQFRLLAVPRETLQAEGAGAVVPADLNDDATAVQLWAEIHRLRAAVKGPDGFETWQDAAVSERVRRVKAEKALAAAALHQPTGTQAAGRDETYLFSVAALEAAAKAAAEAFDYPWKEMPTVGRINMRTIASNIIRAAIAATKGDSSHE
jgi:hypothetical protein